MSPLPCFEEISNALPNICIEFKRILAPAEMIGHHLHEPPGAGTGNSAQSKFTLPLNKRIYHAGSEFMCFPYILKFAFSDCDPVDLSGEFRVLFSEYGKFAVVVAYGHGCRKGADEE